MNRRTNLSPTSVSHSPVRRRIWVWAVTAIAAGGLKVASVATAVPAVISGIILLVGADESQRVVNWYASATTAQVVQLAPTSTLTNGVFPVTAPTYPAVVAANTVN